MLLYVIYSNFKAIKWLFSVQYTGYGGGGTVQGFYSVESLCILEKTRVTGPISTAHAKSTDHVRWTKALQMHMQDLHFESLAFV